MAGRPQRIIAEHLEAVNAGHLKRLIILAPPRHGKSWMGSNLFPTWAMGHRPDRNITLSGYADDITVFHSREAKRIFVSEEYGQVFPDVRLKSHTRSQLNQKGGSVHEWETTAGGRFYAVGVGGGLTGRGTDIGLIDDPVKNRKEADSKTFRNTTWDWYRSTFRTRLSPGGAIVLTMTPWHRDDLAGRLIREMREGGEFAESWTIIKLPAISSDGEALWPERWPLHELQAIKRSVGAREWSALYQQDPAIEGGAIMRAAWWRDRNRYKAEDAHAISNACVSRTISFDTASSKEDDSAYSACVVSELTQSYQMAVKHVERRRVEFVDLLAWVYEISKRFNRDEKLSTILIENKDSGRALIQTLKQQAPEWMRDKIMPVNPVDSKVIRGYAASTYCEGNAVMLPHPSEHAPWLFDFEDELITAPQSEYMDMFDAFTQTVWYYEHYLAAGMGIQILH